MVDSNRSRDNSPHQHGSHPDGLDSIADKVSKAAQTRRAEQQSCYTPQNRELINRIITGLQEL